MSESATILAAQRRYFNSGATLPLPGRRAALKRLLNAVTAREEEILAALAGRYRLFIVSNCHASYIPCFFRAHGLGRFFADYECYGRTQAPKSESIRLLCGRNGLRGPVYVGDTAGDARAAHSAGLPFVYAAYGFGETDEYEYRIERFEDLQGLRLP